MSNYLVQIAARNVATDQPMATPAYSPVAQPTDDPFDGSAFSAPTQEMLQPGEGIRPAATTSSPPGNDVPSVVLPVNEHQPAATPTAVKPVYLSKYIERNVVDARNTSYKSSTQSQNSDSVAGFEHKASPLLPEATKPSEKSVIESQATRTGEINPVQQRGTDRESHVHQESILLQPIESIKQQRSLTPVAAATTAIAAPVFLQPPAPTSSQESTQKEKPPPSLVIGKITVEIVPAQKPVNKIIHQVIKSQPSTPAAPRSKSSFGLGQI
jgi:hypothetical protein